jgi:hypothetical protein
MGREVRHRSRRYGAALGRGWRAACGVRRAACACVRRGAAASRGGGARGSAHLLGREALKEARVVVAHGLRPLPAYWCGRMGQGKAAAAAAAAAASAAAPSAAARRRGDSTPPLLQRARGLQPVARPKVRRPIQTAIWVLRRISGLCSGPQTACRGLPRENTATCEPVPGVGGLHRRRPIQKASNLLACSSRSMEEWSNSPSSAEPTEDSASLEPRRERRRGFKNHTILTSYAGRNEAISSGPRRVAAPGGEAVGAPTASPADVTAAAAAASLRQDQHIAACTAGIATGGYFTRGLIHAHGCMGPAGVVAMRRGSDAPVSCGHLHAPVSCKAAPATAAPVPVHPAAPATGNTAGRSPLLGTRQRPGVGEGGTGAPCARDGTWALHVARHPAGPCYCSWRPTTSAWGSPSWATCSLQAPPHARQPRASALP